MTQTASTRALFRRAVATLREAQSPTPELDVRVLMSYCLGVEPMSLSLATAPPVAEAEFWPLIERRRHGEPVAKIIGSKEFYGLNFVVTTDTLDPRPDSEILVDAVLQLVQKTGKTGARVLDLGTGSGCLLLAILHNLPSDVPPSTGVGIDVSDKAIAVACQNAQALGLNNRTEFLCCDWTEFSLEEAKFDIVLSNPPYIPGDRIDNLSADVREFDPRIALDGGEGGLNCYRVLAEKVPQLLADDGLFFVEIGYGQSSDVTQIFGDNCLKYLDSFSDLSGVPRCLLFAK